MRELVEMRARALFKRQHPGRNWDLIAIRRTAGFEIDNPHASSSERDHFRWLAQEELLREEAEAAECRT